MSVMRKERGFTLVELSIVVIIMGIMATIGVWSKMQELRDELAKSQGQQLVRLNDAIGTYMVNNYAALVNGSPIGGVANTMSPTVAELRTLGILDAGFSANNLYGGGYTTALTLVPAACAPPNCNISSLVYLTTQIIDPNTGRVDGPRLGVAQGVAGGDAAYSLPATPAVFTGSGGGWTAANPLNMAGILAMRNGTGSSAWAQFLRRDGSLPMTGNLDMGGQAINNAATIALNTVVANGAACATNGVVARDANGAVMSCQSGAWRSQGSAFWQDPVVNAASLPACNATSIWQTRVVENPTVGSGPRAYTCNGASWQALAVNDAGNITIPGLMTAANATITGATTTNQLAGNLEVTVTATVNTACSPNGRIARDANGLLLSCQSGLWKGGGGIGQDQTWQNVLASRFAGVDYTNSTGKPIQVTVFIGSGALAYCTALMVVDGISISGSNSGGAGYSQRCSVSAIIPPGSTYRITALTAGNLLHSWVELR